MVAAILQRVLTDASLDDDRVQDLVYQLRRIPSSPLHADVVVETTQQGTLDLNAVAQELPSQQEVASDSATLLRSAYTLIYILVTSAAFRLILADMLVIARETVADVALRVEHVAVFVGKAAADVETTVRPGGGTIEDVTLQSDRLGEKAADELAGDGVVGRQLAEMREKVQQQGPEEMKAVVLRRLQEAIARAHSQPSFQAALRTILALTRKYAAKVRATAAVASTAEAPSIQVMPIVWADAPLARALADLKALLERIASGHSLDRLIDALKAVVLDVVAVPADALSESPNKVAMRDWFASLGDWLDRALADPPYATSRIGQVRIDTLYYDARRLANDAVSDPDSHWVEHIRALLVQVDAFASSLQEDRATQKLVAALSTFAAAVTDVSSTFVATAPGFARERTDHTKREAVRSVVMWVVPKVLRALDTIPMPRVEFINADVEAAVDALLITGPRAGRGALGVTTGLLPDRIRVESWNEVVVEVENIPTSTREEARRESALMSLVAGSGTATHSRDHGKPQPQPSPTRTRTVTKTSTKTRARVHVDGIRLSAHDVAYYVLYKGARCLGVRVPCTAYEDEGLVSVDVGDPSGGSPTGTGTGLSIDVELEFDSGPESESARRQDGWTWASLFDWNNPPTEGQAQAQDEAEDAPLFRVTGVHVDVPGLAITLARSKHWLLNALLVQPLAGPVARRAVGWVLESQIRALLEGAAAFGGRVKKKARDRERQAAQSGLEGPGVEDWWNAVAEEIARGSPAGQPEDEDEDHGSGEDDLHGDEDENDGDETAPLAETHTHATVQGIVRTTVTQASPDAEAEESVLAVGIRAQVLPGKGGPYGATSSSGFAVEEVGVRAREEAREAAGDVAAVEEEVEEGVREGVAKAVEVREEVRDAEARGEVRERVERRRRGWRSEVFDL
ncbi:hypothetical protein C8Q80DRAFT_1107728 [Daedaleopsis nitida]|nr:hypothetical protein C8Q80DRAFT_1107728 [Daedaleopsis nitida]